MKLSLIYVGSLFALAALLVLGGRSPALTQWGPAGVDSMNYAVGICAIAAVVAAIPVLMGAAMQSAQTPLLCLGGTVIRLLVTGMLALAYQSFYTVHLRSFLICLLVAYFAFLAVETAFSVYIVRRRWPASNAGRQSSADDPR